MTIKASIRDYLLANSAVSALLANSAACYSFPAPRSAARPYMMLSRIDEQDERTINEFIDVRYEQWQVDVVADTDAEAEELKDAVIDCLQCADRVQMGTYWVYSSTLIGSEDTSELEDNDSEHRTCRMTRTFDIRRSAREIEGGELDFSVSTNSGLLAVIAAA